MWHINSLTARPMTEGRQESISCCCELCNQCSMLQCLEYSNWKKTWIAISFGSVLWSFLRKGIEVLDCPKTEIILLIKLFYIDSKSFRIYKKTDDCMLSCNVVIIWVDTSLNASISIIYKFIFKRKLIKNKLNFRNIGHVLALATPQLPPSTMYRYLFLVQVHLYSYL